MMECIHTSNKPFFLILNQCTSRAQKFLVFTGSLHPRNLLWVPLMWFRSPLYSLWTTQFLVSDSLS